MKDQILLQANQKTLSKRKAFLDKIELNAALDGFAETRCIECVHACFQASCKKYSEPDYVVPAERRTARQQNSKYWLICLAINKDLDIGDISECELFERLLQGKLGSPLPSSGLLLTRGALGSIT